jgi:8-oxo-dGTP diphosphatase
MSTEAKELLLRDYQYRSESLWKSEAAGETRVNLFIGLITFTAGAVGTLISKEPRWSDSLSAIVPAVALALLLLGIVTFLRMIVRNNNTDLCKHQMDLIRQTYVDQFDRDGSWVHYDLFPTSEKAPRQARVKARDFGGMAQTVAVVNGLLFTVMFAPLLYPVLSDCLPVFGVVLASLFGVAFWLHLHYLRLRKVRFEEAMGRDYPADTHAGGLVYKLQDGVAHYLVVRSSDQQDWVLPKGHIEKGESHLETALREVSEEAGVVARPQGFVGRLQFRATENVRAKFYLMESLGEVPAPEDRKPRWETVSSVLGLLKHEESRSLVRKAEHLRQLRHGGESRPATASPGKTAADAR